MAKASTVYTGRLALFKDGAVVDNPTLAAGDVTVVRADGSVGNIATLPAVNVGDSRVVEYTLSAVEMAGDPGESVTVLFEDQADDEWEPIAIDLPLDTYNLADMGVVIWTYSVRTLTSFGDLVETIIAEMDLQAIASAVWRYARRALTLTAAELSHLLTPGVWTLYRGTTWDEDVELNVNLSTLDEDGEIWFTYKRKPETEDDDDALLQISYHDGLTRLNGAAVEVGDSALGQITIVDAAEGTVNLYVSEVVTAQLELMTRGYFDFKVKLDDTPDDVQLYADGRLRVYRDVTRAI